MVATPSRSWAVQALRSADNWLFASAPPERLAALRILIGGFVVVYLAVIVVELKRLTQLDPARFEPVGLAHVLGDPLPSPWFWSLYGATLLAGLLFVAGLGYRLVGPLFAAGVLFWASYHSSWGQMLHFEHVFTLHVLILGFAPAAAVWSADRHRAREPVDPVELRHRAAPSVRYGWPVRLMALTTVITYLIAGIAKLRLTGVRWVDGTTLGNHIGYSATRLQLLGADPAPLADLLVGRSWLIAPAAVIALGLEIAAPAALAGGWLRRSWVIGVIAMHTGIAAMMFVWFPYQGLGFALLPLYRTERLIRGAAPLRSLLGRNRSGLLLALRAARQ